MFGDIYSNQHRYPMASIGEIAFVTKLAGFEYTQYINYKDHGDKIMVRGLNCKKGKLVLDDVLYENNDVLNKLQRSKLSKGDIVMTYVGTIAETALIDEDNKYHLAPNVAKISLLNKYKTNPVFIIQMLVLFKEYIVSFSNVTSQPKISMEQIRKIPLMVPPIEKQNDFALFVEQVDKLKFNVQQRIEKYKELLNKKMSEYFN